MAGKKAPKVDASADADGGDGATKKTIPLKLLIIGGVAAVVVLGGGGTAAALLLGGGGEETAEAGGDHKPAKKPKPAKGGDQGGGADGAAVYGEVKEGPEGVVFYTLPPLVANIRSGDGKPAFLKLKMTLELPDHETAEVFEPNAPRLNDAFTGFLRELREEDLSGSEGSYELRMELQRRVNLVIAPAHVNGVLIEEMLVQ